MKQISSEVQLTVFKIGNRKGFIRGEFEEKFDAFVKISSKNLATQTQNRQNGATSFNERINAIFSYLAYAEGDSEHDFSYENCLAYLKVYDKDSYSSWRSNQISDFIESRLKGQSCQPKGMKAREAIKKANAESDS